MNALHERYMREEIECHELLKNQDRANDLKNTYINNNSKKSQQKDCEMMIKKNQIFEGTLVPTGWDRLDHVNQSSLYTQDDEDILLEHRIGMKKFAPYLNHKVRIWGDIVSTNRDGKRVLVKKISELLDGFTQPITPLRD